MIKALLNRLSGHQPFAQHELHLKYKVDFLNSVFLLATVVAFGMGFYRWQYSPLMGAIDFGFSLIGLAALYYLKRHREQVEFVSTVAIVLAFLLFFAIYLLAPYNTMRLSLFFLLSAAVFYLKGRTTGLRWLCFILAAIVAGHVLPGLNTGYSHIDIITTCVYLIALFFIFWNYETVRGEQYQREEQHKLQRLIDERWRLALEGAGDAIWDWNIQTNNFIFSKTYADMLGYSEAEIGHTPDHLESLLHPEDKPVIAKHLSDYLSGDNGGQYSVEVRLRCKDGRYKWILCRGCVVQRDDDERPQRMTGTHVDITENRLIQEEILRSREALDEERSLFQTILDNAPLGIWMVNTRGQVQFVNQVFCNATGITEAQFLSACHYSDVLPPSIAANCMQSDKECFEQEEPHLSMEWLSFVDGREHLLEITKVRLFNKDGSLKGLIGLAADITERKEHEKQLEHIAHYDALTGVLNRVLLADRLSQALARTRRDKRLMAVCYLDLDGFKPVNDSFGHKAGDKVLIEVARRIGETIREDDTVARLGGDEFVVLLLGLEMPEECSGSLSRLLQAISKPIEIGDQSVSVSASIGVSLYPEDDVDADTLIRHADHAMYVAKQSGKNRYHLFDAAHDQRARSHHELLQQVQHGLSHGEFELYYQPQVDMQTRRMVGAEALIRWNHPQRGLLPPAEFLNAIENTGLEIELGEWVIASAFAQQCLWREASHHFELSINISAYHLQSAGFVRKLQDMLRQHHLLHCTGCLKIEVLETAALEDMASVGAIITACREFGVGFALDDFGTGYSSLTYLSNLDVDTLKIDRSFVHDMLAVKGDHAIVQGIIALSKAFERSVVAEGVETDAHYQALLQMGCEIGQGYDIARPMPASAVPAWLLASGAVA